jgi:DedD protein
LEVSVKQRVVGAIVLIALGVIFIPMLLDGAGMKEQEALEIRIPEKPRYDFPRQIKPQTLPEQAASTGPVVVKPEPEKPRVEPKPVPKPRPQPVRPSVDIEREPDIKPTPLSSYVVQVGSFGNRTNALNLRDKIRKAGYPAFIESFSTGSKTMVRVKVGPVLKRKEAEKIKTQLKKDMKLDGRVLMQQ